MENEIALSNPEALEVLTEIKRDAKMPELMLAGNAINTINYIADGEANDYILKTFDIPSVSPELANDNIFSRNHWFLPYKFLTREVLRDNHPYIYHTIKKIGGELSILPQTHSTLLAKNDHVQFSFKVRNTGMSEWKMETEG